MWVVIAGHSCRRLPAWTLEARHRPETTLLYQLVDAHYPAFTDQMAMHGTPLPEYVERELEDYLKCGRLEHGFLRVRCVSCHAEHLVAFSCKRRGFCPSCGARRMAESAALLVDEVLPEAPMRQWVLSFPFPLRFNKTFFANQSLPLRQFSLYKSANRFVRELITIDSRGGQRLGEC